MAQTREMGIPSDRSQDKGRSSGQFDRFASACARWAGHPVAFALAVASTVLWALLGPVFGFSDTWQLIINTATTVLTFLMVFILQNTLNRDSRALHIKLDELILVTREAHDSLVGVEDLTQKDLDEIRESKVARIHGPNGSDGVDEGFPDGPAGKDLER